MEKKRESGEILEHMLLEEVKIEDIDYIDPPDEWDPELHQKEPNVPPVLIEEKSDEEGGDGRESRGYSLLAHHRSFWKAHAKGLFTLRALVVRSSVHISLAHESIRNCTEEALLFDALLRNGLCENRSRLSELLGYSRARITQILNLLKLPEGMRRKLLLTDDISEFQLRPIVRIADKGSQKNMFNHLIKGKLTGRQMALFADEKEKAVEDDSEPPADIEYLMNEDVQLDEPEIIPLNDQEESEDEPASGAVVQSSYTSELMKHLKLRGNEWEKRLEIKGVSRIDTEFLKGILKLRTGLYSAAVEILEGVIEANPNYAPAYFYLGRCKNLLGDPASAENALRSALEMLPEEPDYLVELAIVLEKLKRDTEASAFYRKAGSIRKRSRTGALS
ncbi:MAG: tetratricopeptide repeat protein [Candidatus Aegiribacteria sp.]|nr:tetratricopeptide repeat protein [Candidatus Aegiribacteria sp.]